MAEHNPYSQSRGFTLIELIIVVIILGILSSIAAPSLSEMLRSQGVRSIALDIYGDIAFARSEAIKRNTEVSVTPRDTSTPRDWAKGWDVVLSPSTVLKAREPLASGLSAPGGNSISFRGAGRPTGTLAVTVKHDDLPSRNWRCVTVELSGRVSSKEAGCP